MYVCMYVCIPCCRLMKAENIWTRHQGELQCSKSASLSFLYTQLLPTHFVSIVILVRSNYFPSFIFFLIITYHFSLISFIHFNFLLNLSTQFIFSLHYYYTYIMDSWSIKKIKKWASVKLDFKNKRLHVWA